VGEPDSATADSPHRARPSSPYWTRALTAAVAIAALIAIPVITFFGLLGASCLAEGSECVGLPVFGQVVFVVGVVACGLVAVSGSIYAVRANETAGRVFGWATIVAVSPVVYLVLAELTRAR
jgi:hypothetical protein